MRARFALIATLLAALAAPLPALAAAPSPGPKPSASPSAPPGDLVENVDQATIDWTTGTLSVSGIGLPSDRGAIAFKRKLSIRAATADAYRRLDAAIQGLRVDAGSRFRDLAVGDAALAARLTDFVKRAKVAETNTWPDHSAEVVLSVPLRGAGGVSSLLMAAPPPSPSPTAPPSAAPAAVPGAKPADALKRGALVVDARGLGAQPALTPRLRDPENRVIELASALDGVPVRYVRGDGEGDPALALRPLKIKAQRVSGSLFADLILDRAGTEALQDALRKGELGAETRYVILL